MLRAVSRICLLEVLLLAEKALFWMQKPRRNENERIESLPSAAERNEGTNTSFWKMNCFSYKRKMSGSGKLYKTRFRSMLKIF